MWVFRLRTNVHSKVLRGSARLEEDTQIALYANSSEIDRLDSIKNLNIDFCSKTSDSVFGPAFWIQALKGSRQLPACELNRPQASSFPIELDKATYDPALSERGSGKSRLTSESAVPQAVEFPCWAWLSLDRSNARRQDMSPDSTRAIGWSGIHSYTSE